MVSVFNLCLAEPIPVSGSLLPFLAFVGLTGEYAVESSGMPGSDLPMYEGRN